MRITNKQRVASRGVERTGVERLEIEKAQQRYRQVQGHTGDRADRINYPDRIYRAVRKRPLLIVHLLKIDSESGAVEYPKPVIAWSISFPQTHLEEKRVEYVVNTTWLRENYSNDIEDDEIGGDDE